MELLALIRALVSLPAALDRLAESIGGFNEQMRSAKAQERLEDKRDRNRVAVDNVLRGDAETGQRGEAD